MSDALKRAARTFVQAFLGAFLTSGVLSAVATEGVVDWRVIEKAGVAALAAGLIGAVSFVHNALEEKTALPTVLK